MTMPPPSSRALPFSRTVTVITTSLVSWPAIERVWPVSFTSKSTSISRAGLSCCGASPSFGAFLGLLARLTHPAAELVEGHDLVGLLLDVELVDLLFLQIDDAAGRVVHLRLAIALHGDGGETPSLAAFAAEHAHHPAEHALELHLRLVAGLDVGQAGTGGQHDERQGNRKHSSTHGSFAFPPGQSAILFRASASLTRPRSRRYARLTPAA